MTLATGWGCWNQPKGPSALLAPIVWLFPRLSFLGWHYFLRFQTVSRLVLSLQSLVACYFLRFHPRILRRMHALTTGSGCPPAPTTAWDLARLRSSTQKGKDVETDDRFPVCSSAEVPMMRDSVFWSAVTIFIYPIQETVFLEPAFLGFWLNDSHISDLPIFH